MEESETKTGDLELSELKIEKYPMANSPNFIEYFLIMGYEESFIEEKIIKNINIQIESKQSEQLDDNNKNKNTNINEIQEFRCRQLPTILFSINSNFSGILARENVLIKFNVSSCDLSSTKINSILSKPMVCVLMESKVFSIVSFELYVGTIIVNS